MSSPTGLAGLAVAAASGDAITLTGVSARGFHGVLPSERVNGQTFIVDIRLELDLGPAGAGDDLALTVNYAEVAADAVGVITGLPVDLIETVAARIATAALARHRVEAVEVTVHKPEAPVGVPFADVSVQVRLERDVPVVIALGGNEGDPDRLVDILGSAVRELAQVGGLRVRGVSRLFRTDPVGGPEQPDYLNAVLVARTRLTPQTLLRQMQEIELRHGRRREVRWGPRTLDLDLIQYGDPSLPPGQVGAEVVSDTDDLVLPHPRAFERAFVLVPWLDVEPEACLRRGALVVPVRQLLEMLSGPTAIADRDVGDRADMAGAPGAAGVEPGPSWSSPGSFRW